MVAHLADRSNAFQRPVIYRSTSNAVSQDKYDVHVLPSLLLKFLVRLISFLYLCFFIFSFLCLFTLIAYISGPLFSAVRSRCSSNRSCLACKRESNGCRVAKGMSWRWTKGPVDAEYSCSPDGRVCSVIVRVVVKCLSGDVSVASASDARSSCCWGSSFMGTGTGGVLKGLNCLTSSSRDGVALAACLVGPPSEFDDDCCSTSQRRSFSSLTDGSPSSAETAFEMV